MRVSEPSDQPIFYDPSGKRWLWIKILTLTFICAFGYAAYSFAPAILTPDASVASASDELSIDKRYFSKQTILAETAGKNVPVIGKGPLVRVVLVVNDKDTYRAFDVYSKTATRTLEEREVAAVNGDLYAIERFGDTSGRHVALTFDDGPDPVYSPQLLDVLSAGGAPATFFVIGENVVKYPEIANRMTKEGHILGNHTFSHIDFDFANSFAATQEINQTRRVIRAVTSHDSTYFRVPYGGDSDQSMRQNLGAILETQMLGYVNASFNFDPNDWDATKSDSLALPKFDGNSIIALLHDGGGDRTHTIEYVKKLIPAAKQNGYTFTTLDGLFTELAPRFKKTTPEPADVISLTAANAAIVWPRQIVSQLFTLTVISLLLGLIINSVLATLQHRKPPYKRRSRKYHPPVSVVVPAYNEGTVLNKTVRSLLRSYYRKLEVIIVDDGSTDETWHLAHGLVKSSKRVRRLRQLRNRGKAAALNKGIKKAKGEVIICIDADTIFSPSTVGRLIRHFEDPSVGGVAGAVKVGNVKGMLTRWQALEYTIGIYLERSAHAYLGAIMITPGACGAWRKSAVLAARGYSPRTLAEDCDLTLSVRQAGFQVIQDVSAIGYTEAPDTVRTLAKQRFRWIFGNIQSIWKHRSILFNGQFGWLGNFVMPYAAFNILLPILFIPLLFMLAIENIAAGRYMVVLLFAGITLLIQYVTAIISLVLARERPSYLLAVPLTRLIYSPLKGYLLYRAFLTAVKGTRVGWNKLQRKGTAHLQTKEGLDTSQAKL